jgi:hypothetical protein
LSRSSVRFGPIQGRVRNPQCPDSKLWPSCCGTSKPRRGSRKVHGRLGDIAPVIRSTSTVVY